MSSTRRVFLSTAAIAGCATICGTAFAATGGAMVDENDPQAKALGYVTDATKVDPAKYPKYEKGQHCANCALFQGKESDPAAPCALFGGKQVAGPGWCSAWSKKA